MSYTAVGEEVLPLDSTPMLTQSTSCASHKVLDFQVSVHLYEASALAPPPPGYGKGGVRIFLT